MGEKKPKAFLFDMGDTLIHEKGPDFVAGMQRLLSLATPQPRAAVHPEAVLAYADNLIKELLLARESTMVEFSCIALHRLLSAHFGIAFEQSPQEIEYEFRRASFHSVAAPGIPDLLLHLHEKNIRRAVLSNAIFTHTTLENDLQRLDLLNHFEFVMSSVDYCLRKPHSALFLAAAGRLDLSPEDIWFAGDNWDCDIEGAAAVGMKTIWYNPWNRPRPNGNRPTFEVKSWTEFLELVRGIW